MFKDLATKEIVANEVSNRMDIKLVKTALVKAIEGLHPSKKSHLMIHSDQGFHFTHFNFRNYLVENGVLQSMSRKGNCIYNAPVESFFGYLKDHLDLRDCRNVDEVKI